MKKKILSLALIIVMLVGAMLTLSGCGDEEKSSNRENNDINSSDVSNVSNGAKKYVTDEEIIDAYFECINSGNYYSINNLYNDKLDLAYSISTRYDLEIDYAYNIVDQLDKGADYINENYSDFVDKYLTRTKTIISPERGRETITEKIAEKLNDDDSIFSYIQERQEKRNKEIEELKDIKKIEINNIGKTEGANGVNIYTIKCTLTIKDEEMEESMDLLVMKWNDECYLLDF